MSSIALVGFEGSAGGFGVERRGGDQTGDIELFKAAGDAEAAGAGFVGDFQAATGMSLTDAGQGFFEGMQVVW